MTPPPIPPAIEPSAPDGPLGLAPRTLAPGGSLVPRLLRYITREDRRLYVLYALLLLAFAANEALAAAGLLPPVSFEPIRLRGAGALFILTALLGSFLLQLGLFPSRREVIATLLLGAAMAALWASQGWLPEGGPEALGVPLGGAALLVAAGSVAVSRGAERERSRQRFMAIALPPSFVIASTLGIYATVPLHPKVFDGFIRAFDVSLGVEPGLALARLVAAAPPLGFVAGRIYFAAPLAFAGLYLLQRRARTPPPIDVLWAFALASVAGFALYHVLPVVGPVVAMGRDPLSAPLPLAPADAPPEPRNCMPSLHTAWALLVLWNSRERGPAVRVAAALFAGFTLLATLAFGLHYLVDLVVAVPFALAVQAAVAPRSAARRIGLLAGSGATLLWLAALRTGVLVARPSVAVSWALVLLTVGAGLLLERRIWSESLPRQAAV